MYYCIVIKPLCQFALPPHASALVALFCVDDAAESVLTTFYPLALVFASVGVGVGPVTVFFVVSVVSFVFSAILPDVGTETVHHALFELA